MHTKASKAGSKALWGLKGLTVIIRERILKAKPEWENALLDTFLKRVDPHPDSVEKQD